MGTGDVLQNLANEFSEYYGLAIVKIPFAEVSRKFVKLYNFVFAPQHGEWLGKLDQEVALMGGRLEKEDVAEAKKDILWRKYIYNPHAKEFVAEIEKENIRILEVAIKVCESKSASSSNAQSISHSFGLSLPEAEKALEVIKRISIFHAEGKAINEFHDLLRICKENPGAMPLAEPFEEQYVHEAIHVILTKNGIYAYGPLNPGLSRAFDEGLCAYLHIRLRGKLRTFGQYFRHEYQMYIPFFKNLLDTVSHQNVGGYVKLHFGQIMRNLHNFLSTGNIYERIPT